MKALLIGMGSVAQKHLDALKRIQPECEVVALRSGHSSRQTEGIQNIYRWEEVPDDLDFVMICNPTSEHYQTIDKSSGLGVPLFIEKPPLMYIKGAQRLIQKLQSKGVRTYTAFPFRFHSAIKWFKKNLSDRRVLEVQAYCGSYLPDWRPDRDYREVYSAKRELGGGVHLDLSHEIDYLLYLFGHPLDVNAYRSKVSGLEINSFDIAHYWMQYESFNTSVTLNYYRRDPKRSLEIVMAEDTWSTDLINQTITDSSGNIIFENDQPLSEIYYQQMKYFLNGLQQEQEYMNSLSESVKTLEYCLSET